TRRRSPARSASSRSGRRSASRRAAAAAWSRRRTCRRRSSPSSRTTESASLRRRTAMTAHRRARPGATEYAPFYANYIAQVPDGDVVEALIGGVEIAAALLHDVPDDRAMRAYAPGKWTLKE